MTGIDAASDVLTELRASLARIESGASTSAAEVPEGAEEPKAKRGKVVRDKSDRPDAERGGRSADREAPKDPYAFARAIVLRQLSNAPKSRQQLREALAKRECPDDVAEAVLDRMTEVGLVDDEAFATLLVRSKQSSRGLARRALSEELRKKGIDADVASAVLDDIEPAAERAIARRLVDKKLATMHGLEVSVQTRRLAAMLARKGYAGDMAWAVIRDAIADAPEHQRD